MSTSFTDQHKFFSLLPRRPSPTGIRVREHPRAGNLFKDAGKHGLPIVRGTERRCRGRMRDYLDRPRVTYTSTFFKWFQRVVVPSGFERVTFRGTYDGSGHAIRLTNKVPSKRLEKVTGHCAPSRLIARHGLPSSVSRGSRGRSGYRVSIIVIGILWDSFRSGPIYRIPNPITHKRLCRVLAGLSEAALLAATGSTSRSGFFDVVDPHCRVGHDQLKELTAVNVHRYQVPG